MKIDISVDIEDEIRKGLSKYITTYCRPLPATVSLPSVEVRRIGGMDTNTIDTFMVMLYARAEHEAEADLTLRKALGILDAVSKQQTTAIRNITVNSSGSWQVDPVRPDLAMCSATIMVVAHKSKLEV